MSEENKERKPFSLEEHGMMKRESALYQLSQAQLELCVNKLIDAIYDTINTGMITCENALGVCINLMKIVETIPNLRGAQKKELVILAITHVVNLGKGDLPVLGLIPNFIELALNLEKGVISIHNLAETTVKCAFLCCGK